MTQRTVGIVLMVSLMIAWFAIGAANSYRAEHCDHVCQLANELGGEMP